MAFVSPNTIDLKLESKLDFCTYCLVISLVRIQLARCSS